MRGFEGGEEKPQVEETFASACARKLLNATKRKRKNMRTVTFPRWVEEFDKLCKDYTEAEITRVLDWYVEHMGEEFVPEAFSASGFRSKFRQIQAQTARSIDVEISPAAQFILSRLGDLNWPKGSDGVLPVVVQSSLDNFHVFRERFDRLYSNLRDLALKASLTPGDERLLRFMHYITGSAYLTPGNFVRTWILDINSLVAWDGFRGTIENLGFSPDSPRFQKMGEDWAYSWCKNSNIWRLLMERVRDGSTER